MSFLSNLFQIFIKIIISNNYDLLIQIIGLIAAIGVLITLPKRSDDEDDVLPAEKYSEYPPQYHDDYSY